MRRHHDLDAKDRQILALLEEDGRRSNSDIARLTQLSGPTVAERIARLRDTGVIRGFTVDINPARVGLPIAAIVEFQPRSNDDRGALEAVTGHPSVRSCYTVTGPTLLILMVRVADNLALKNLLQEFSRYGESKTSLILAASFEDRPMFAELPKSAA